MNFKTITFSENRQIKGIANNKLSYSVVKILGLYTLIVIFVRIIAFALILHSGFNFFEACPELK